MEIMQNYTILTHIQHKMPCENNVDKSKSPVDNVCGGT